MNEERTKKYLIGKCTNIIDRLLLSDKFEKYNRWELSDENLKEAEKQAKDICRILNEILEERESDE